jgi:hypothetical protein
VILTLDMERGIVYSGANSGSGTENIWSSFPFLLDWLRLDFFKKISDRRMIKSFVDR